MSRSIERSPHHSLLLLSFTSFLVVFQKGGELQFLIGWLDEAIPTRELASAIVLDDSIEIESHRNPRLKRDIRGRGGGEEAAHNDGNLQGEFEDRAQ